MDAVIERKTISKLLGMNFFIPNYQRGYRWTKQQVRDLLKDIYFFTQNKNQGEFYCLQPVVVRKMTEADLNKFKLEGDWFEVIDGQQRLTTIKIILKFLVLDYLAGKPLKDEYGKNEFRIKYETREGSESFIDELKLDTPIIDTNIDYYHITNALLEVKTWFSEQEKARSAKEKILHTFVYDEDDKDNYDGTVQVIWYETQEKSPTAVFKRLNGGKIPLTNAELIKALFLNSSNFSNEIEEQTYDEFLKSRIYLRQLEIATTWDKIEYTLHDDEFWLFLHDDSYTNPTRIDFIFDLIKTNDYLNVKQTCFNNNEQEYFNIIGKDTYQTFRYFERFLTDSNLKEKEKRLEECWKKIKSIYEIFVEWYQDIELYHYIGYLNYFENDISSIYKLWEESKDRICFMQELKKRINVKISKSNNLNMQYSYSDASGRYPDKTTVLPLLLLHNIQTVINQNKDFKNKSDYSLTLYYKFPFHLFKRETWNIEHIYPETTNTLEDKAEQKEWLLSVYNSKIDENLKKQIKKFLSSDFGNKDDERNKNFRELYECYYNSLPESEKNQLLTGAERNKLWNFVLLDEHTNKSYGNAIFSVKRRFIIGKDQGEKWDYNTETFELEKVAIKENDKEKYSAFVPVCTKNAFMKFYTPYPNDLSDWTKEDAYNYLANIKDVLCEFDIKEE